MRNAILMTLFLFSCSTFNRQESYQRNIASTKGQDLPPFDLKLIPESVFANGANSVRLKVTVKNEQQIQAADLKVISDTATTNGNFKFINGAFEIIIKPKVKSSNIKFKLIWKDQVGPEIELKTTLIPLTDKLIPLKSNSNTMQWVSGITYLRQDSYPEGQYEAFQIDNKGKNVIAHAEDSYREFEFQFDEQARQNISLFMSDAPNSTVSHTMHSLFMFFPRKYLPYAELNNKEVTVILPTGEQMMFAESGELIDGVFEEGPIDIGPDRFKRTYADLKYNGKGILLRANARGQMPQQGQFESTKIDMEYGIKNSADVLIINGTTGQRCRRPKTDFWLAADVSPILFKFPTDAEFDAYLKEKCNFGIPHFEDRPKTTTEDKISDITSSIWNKCQNESKIQNCLAQESEQIENETTKSKVVFDLELTYLKAKEAEKFEIPEIIAKEIISIRASLLAEASWMKQQSCLEKSKTLIKSSFKYHDTFPLMQDRLVKNCSTIKDEIDKIAAADVASIQRKLEANFDWASITTIDRFGSDCQKQALKLIGPEQRYHLTPDIYIPSLKTICSLVESSDAYKSWLLTQGAGLEDKIFAQLLIDVEVRGETQAKSCLKSYPTDTQLNRMRYKTQRENCLIDNWYMLEAEAIKSAKEDPLVQRVGLSFDSINTRIAIERRRIQLKVMKKYYL